MKQENDQDVSAELQEIVEEISRFSEMNKRLIAENKALNAKNAETFFGLNQSLSKLTYEMGNRDPLLAEQVDSLREVLLTAQTASVKEQRKLRKQTETSIRILSDIAAPSEEQKALLATALETRKVLKRNTRVSERFDETAKEFTMKGIATLVSTLNDSPLFSMTADFIGKKIGERREAKKLHMDTVRNQLLKSQEDSIKKLAKAKQPQDQKVEEQNVKKQKVEKVEEEKPVQQGVSADLPDFESEYMENVSSTNIDEGIIDTALDGMDSETRRQVQELFEVGLLDKEQLMDQMMRETGMSREDLSGPGGVPQEFMDKVIQYLSIISADVKKLLDVQQKIWQIQDRTADFAEENRREASRRFKESTVEKYQNMAGTGGKKGSVVGESVAAGGGLLGGLLGGDSIMDEILGGYIAHKIIGSKTGQKVAGAFGKAKGAVKGAAKGTVQAVKKVPGVAKQVLKSTPQIAKAAATGGAQLAKGAATTGAKALGTMAASAAPYAGPGLAVAAAGAGGYALGTLINDTIEKHIYNGQGSIGSSIADLFQDVKVDEQQLKKHARLQIDNITVAAAPAYVNQLEEKGIIDKDWIGNSDVEDWEALEKESLNTLKGLYAYNDLSEEDQARLEEIIVRKQEESQNRVQRGGMPVGAGDLGSVSEKYESGGRGAGTISSGRGDYGGKSYGTYQLASNTGTLSNFLSRSGYEDQFTGLKPGSPEFDAKWRELAQNPEFGKAQQDFIKATHYDPLMRQLQEQGIDLSDRGRAVQEAVFSTSTQYGNLGKGVFQGALRDKDIAAMSDAEIVQAVQDYKAANVETNFRSSSPEVQRSVANRIERERADLVALAEQEAMFPEKLEVPTETMVASVEGADTYAPAVNKIDNYSTQIDTIASREAIAKEEEARLQHEQTRKASNNVNISNSSNTVIGRANDIRNTNDEDVVFNRISNSQHAY